MLPVAFERAGPLVERTIRAGVGAIQHPTAVTTRPTSPTSRKHAQMLRHRGLRQFQRIDDVADRALVGREKGQDRPPLRLGDGIEDIRARGGTRHTLIVCLYGICQDQPFGHFQTDSSRFFAHRVG